MDQLFAQNKQLKVLLRFMVKLNQLLVKYRQQVEEMTANCTCRGCELTEPLEEQYQAVMEEAGQIEMTAPKEISFNSISCSLNKKTSDEKVSEMSCQNEDECSKILSDNLNKSADEEEAKRSNVLMKNLRKRPIKVNYAEKKEECNQNKRRRGRPRKVDMKKDDAKCEDEKRLNVKVKDYQENDKAIKEQQKFIEKQNRDLSQYKTNADGLFVGVDRPKFVRGQNTWLCDVSGCDFVCNRRRFLVDHKKIKHEGERIKCEECDKSFKHTSSLKEHKKTVHSEKKWRCQQPNCDKSFGNPKHLKMHQLTHTDFKPFACTWPGCNYRALYRAILQAHLRHLHSDERPFSCTFEGCDKKFKTIYLMKSHKMMVHECIRRFKCSWPGCDNEYKTKKPLIRHQLNHKGLKPAVCNWPGCEFKTVTDAHLRKHIRYVHERIRKHPCTWPGCDKKFFDKQRLKEHVNTHTGHKPVKCLDPDCSWTFIQRSNMLKHYRNIHEKKTKLS